nr:MAG TPA: hypothetical protein [Caudoviricetes sp.]
MLTQLYHTNLTTTRYCGPRNKKSRYDVSIAQKNVYNRYVIKRI